MNDVLSENFFSKVVNKINSGESNPMLGIINEHKKIKSLRDILTYTFIGIILLSLVSLFFGVLMVNLGNIHIAKVLFSLPEFMILVSFFFFIASLFSINTEKRYADVLKKTYAFEQHKSLIYEAEALGNEANYIKNFLNNRKVNKENGITEIEMNAVRSILMDIERRKN